jgi:BirA family transcriptional regulator, biotin operon repressor / biotin---[acetyl-CoA-carboxylase] ligase
MDQQQFQTILDKHKIPAYRYFDQVGSTNDIALDWLSSDDAPEYALVMANAQTSGRGRNGRKWVTTPGASIALSIILHPSLAEQHQLGIFSLATGLAVARTITSHCQGNVQVKWPNDVLIARMKTAGTLIEAVWAGDQLKGLVLGIGINLLRAAIPPASGLLFPATCLQDHASGTPETLALLDTLLANLFAVRRQMLDQGFAQMYTRRMAFLNEPITLHTAEDVSCNGILHGIDPSGNILLKIEDGQLRSFPIGDISLRPA